MGSTTVALLLMLSAGAAAAEPPSSTDGSATPASRPLLLDGAYPLEVSAAFHSALLHWLDSLAALNPPIGTSGKTVEAHRKAYRLAFGVPTERDIETLRRFRKARADFADGKRGDASHGLTLAFFEAPDLDAALQRARTMLSEENADGLEESLRHYAPRYREIWQDGKIPRTFLERAGKRRLAALGEFLVEVARFYGVPPDQEPRPHVVLAPVDPGFGTHAQAIDRFLLIEIRHWEGVLDEVAPIVHENAHFLAQRMDRDRTDALEAFANERGTSARGAWKLLTEALPTAIAQGVAEQKFHPGRWSMRDNWYHVDAIDGYAKALFPIVKKALENDGSFDTAFLKKALSVYRK